MMLEHALACVEQGWAVFPLVPNTKRPLTKNGFKDASKSTFAVRKWWTEHPDANIGLATGEMSGLIVIDVDVKNGAKGRESLGQLKGLPPTLTVATPSGGWHLYYLYPPGGLRSKNGLLPGIDLKADGGYVVAVGSVIDGNPYGYIDAEAHFVSIPGDILENLSRSRNGNGTHPAPAPPVGDVIADGARNSTLASIAGSMRRRGADAEAITAALKVLNAKRCRPPLTDDEVESISASIARYSPESSAPNANENKPSTTDSEEEAMPPGFTDDALALEFTEKHADEWRYVAGWGHWLCWVGTHWSRETTLKAFDLSRKICREAAARCIKPKIAAKVASAATVAAVERLARADRRHAATVDQWDQDPWLINTPSGKVDLRTGAGMPHERSDHMTKIATATPRGEAPAWRAFLEDITDGDRELQAYLARVAGYALTGVTTEHALFFLYGTGANGKSVFLNTLAAVLGDYATNAPMETFLESRGERHPTDLAGLRGARLVTAIEVEKGRRWAEAKIKSLTGGDRISARFMRQDFFEYKPQFKLIIAGNHKPSLRDVDEAMRRRLHLVPFMVTIPQGRRDKTLPERLLAERDGILLWALAGCLEWQRIGLKPPARVVSATEEYLESEDSMGRWLDDECVKSDRATITSEELFQSWKTWAEKQGEYVGSMKKFAEDLTKRGFQRWRSGQKKGVRGLSLRGKETQEEML